MIELILIVVFFWLLFGIFHRLRRPRIKYTTRWSRARDERRQLAQLHAYLKDSPLIRKQAGPAIQPQSDYASDHDDRWTWEKIGGLQ